MSIENYSNYVFENEFKTVKITTFNIILTSTKCYYSYNLPRAKYDTSVQFFYSVKIQL